jgi:predicted short-subunit dehydrogenase-like oxidoreductase (DUF2520 family)
VTLPVCYPRGVPDTRKRAPRTKPSISIVGPGNLGTALAIELARIGYPVRQIFSRPKSAAVKTGHALARRVKAQHLFVGEAALDSDILWLTVPDDAITEVAEQLAPTQAWRGKVVLHPSGALTSDELAALKARGAKVASAHPMMTFVRGRKPAWRGVAFALEGDAGAVQTAFMIARDLGGNPFQIAKENKALYHAFGAFASPLLVALMSAMEQVAEAAGVPPKKAKQMVWPLLSQTLQNYLEKGGARAFSGPLVRGDVKTVRKHLEELRRAPEAREVYLALARAAIQRLPVKNQKALGKELWNKAHTRPAKRDNRSKPSASALRKR